MTVFECTKKSKKKQLFAITKAKKGLDANKSKELSWVGYFTK